MRNCIIILCKVRKIFRTSGLLTEKLYQTSSLIHSAKHEHQVCLQDILNIIRDPRCLLSSSLLEPSGPLRLQNLLVLSSSFYLYLCKMTEGGGQTGRQQKKRGPLPNILILLLLPSLRTHKRCTNKLLVNLNMYNSIYSPPPPSNYSKTIKEPGRMWGEL